METKFQKQKNVLSEANINDREQTNLVNNRNKSKSGLIPTKLPLVYRRGNVLTVKNGLNLDRKSELWGILLLSGTMVALQCGPGNNVPSTKWRSVKKFVETIRYNGKTGFLPSKNVLKTRWGTEEKAKFKATVKVLNEHNIEADDYRGYLWCSEECRHTDAYSFSLINGAGVGIDKNDTNGFDRVAIAF